MDGVRENKREFNGRKEKRRGGRKRETETDR